MEELTYTVPPADEGRKLKRVILSAMGVSPSLYAKLKFEGSVTVDGAPARGDLRLRSGQMIVLRHAPRPAYQPGACEKKAPILFADEHLLIVDKPAPMACQSGPGKPDDTLENALFASLGCPADFIYRPVNRLDRGTSGLMAVARTAHAHARLQRLLHTPAFTRAYLGIAEGTLFPARGVIDQPIAREQGVKRRVDPAGKTAVTHYETLEVRKGRSLMKFQLETGRTHQIRVHMAAVGAPLVGDWLYGREDPELPGRFALHCFRLCLRHPVTGEWLQFESPLPKELAAFGLGAFGK